MGKITVTTTDKAGKVKSVKSAFIKSKPRARVSKQVKSYVKKAISSNAEKKYAQLLISPMSCFGTGIDSTQVTVAQTGRGYTYQGFGQAGISLIPGLAQGEQSGQRIGEKIQPRSFMLNYIFNAHPLTDGTDAGPNTCPYKDYAGKPFKLVCFVYYRRDIRNAIANNSLVDNGQSTGAIITAFDLLKPLNRNKFVILARRTFTMYPSHLKTSSGGVVTYTPLNDVEGNFKSTVMGKMKVKLPKVLKYEGTTTQPLNSQVYLAWGCVNMDNSSIADAHIRATGDMVSKLYYEDS